MGQRSRSADHPGASSQRSFPLLPLVEPPFVLVAEDDFELRRLLRRALERQGYRVREAGDGREALRCLGSLIPPRRLPIGPDAVIADVRMPHFSGLEVLEAARLIDGSLPVFLITAFGDSECRETARQLRVDGLFEKPVDIAELVEALRRRLPPDWSPV